MLVRLWLMTIRIRMSEQDLEAITLQGQPITFIIWHNRLLMTAEIVRRYRGGHPIYGLISASNDGAWLAGFFSSVGIRAVRGSSSRFGREAATALVDVLRAGFDVGITPDGPRGPAYEMKPGALIVARRAHSQVVLVGMDFESAWRVSSWDGFYLPKPFSFIHMRFELVELDELSDRGEAARQLGVRLVAMNPDRIPAPVRTRA